MNITLSDHFGYRKLLRFTLPTISTVRTLVFETAAVFILPVLFGVDGIWFAILCAEVLSLVLSVAMLKKHRGRYRYA